MNRTYGSSLARRILAWSWLLLLAVAVPVHGDELQLTTGGAPLPSPYTLAPGAALEFAVQGGSGAYSVQHHAGDGGAEGTLVELSAGAYRYTAPASGAFAGEYLIEVYDAAGGAQAQQRVRVPLVVERSQSEALGGPDAVVITVRGATAGAAVELAVVDTQGLPAEALVPPQNAPLAGSDAATGHPAQASLSTRRVSALETVRVRATVGGLSADSGVIEVLPAQEYAGRVHGADGAALAQALITLVDVSVAGRSFEVENDSAGVFQMLAPAGEGELRIEAQAYQSATVAAQSCATDAGMLPACTVTLSPDEGERVLAPRFDPDGGSLKAADADVRITSPTPGALLRYTLDGSDPSREHGTALESGEFIRLADSTTLRAIAYMDGMLDSEIAEAEYQVTQTKIAAPSFDPPPGTYVGEVTITLSSASNNATIAYTLDDSEPSPSHGVQVSSGTRFTLSESTTVRAMAYRGKHSSDESILLFSAAAEDDDYEESEVVTASFLVMNDDDGGNGGDNGDPLPGDGNGDDNGDPLPGDGNGGDNGDPPPGDGNGGDNGDPLPGDGNGGDNGDPLPGDGNGGDNGEPPPGDGNGGDNGEPPPGNGGDNGEPPPGDGNGGDDGDPPPGDGNGGDNGDPPPGDGNGGDNGGPPPGDGNGGDDGDPTPSDENGGDGSTDPEVDGGTQGPRLGGGGGCALNAGGPGDPLLPLLMALAIWQLRRRIRGARHRDVQP